MLSTARGRDPSSASRRVLRTILAALALSVAVAQAPERVLEAEAAEPQPLVAAEDLARLKAMRVASALGETLSVEGLAPLREGVERFFITDINNPAASTMMQSEIPVMFERFTGPEAIDGWNVLYMDGHVEFIPFGASFPATQGVKKLLAPEKSD